jgi:dTMP kinase
MPAVPRSRRRGIGGHRDLLNATGVPLSAPSVARSGPHKSASDKRFSRRRRGAGRATPVGVNNRGRRGVDAGVLLVFEGLDGSGKSTQLPLLAAALRGAGHTVVETREPYDCPAGRRIRQAIQRGEEDGGLTREQELQLFLEQREDHVRDVIAPALARGEIVLSDRYYLSTVAYQGARGLDPAQLLRESEARFPVPDLVLWLDLPVAEGLARVDARGAGREAAFEQADFLGRVHGILAALRCAYLCRVDALGTPAAVAERVAATVAERTRLPAERGDVSRPPR